MWSYIAGGLKIKVIYHRKLPFGATISGLIIKGGLKIEGCKIEGLLYQLLSQKHFFKCSIQVIIDRCNYVVMWCQLVNWTSVCHEKCLLYVLYLPTFC